MGNLTHAVMQTRGAECLSSVGCWGSRDKTELGPGASALETGYCAPSTLSLSLPTALRTTGLTNLMHLVGLLVTVLRFEKHVQ